jgi:hypothetical protein
MANSLAELLRRRPPPELFHYTSLPGLIGIVNTRSIWASKISHLNDAAELLLTLDRASKVIRRLTVRDWIKDELLNLLDCVRHGPGNLFVFSLTEHGDQLSQWRGYTAPGSGYSIGFSSEFLVAASKSWQLSLGPCCYDKDVQGRIVEDIVTDAVNTRLELSPPETLRSNTVGEPFCDALLFAAPFLKDGGFSEESEWRLVAQGVAFQDSRLCHRAGASYVVPYLELGFDKLGSTASEAIRTIIVGPTPHPSLASDSAWSLLASRSFTGWNVESSKIPYRQW